MGYDEYERQIIVAQEQWNKDRDANYRTVAQNIGYHGEVEEPELDQAETFDHMPLEDMVGGVNQMKPTRVQHASQQWWKIADAFLSAYGDFARAFQNTVEAPSLGNKPAWGGAAADAAVESVRDYADQAGDLFSAAWLVSLKLDEMFTGLSETQALMPDVGTRPDLAGKILPKNGVMKAGDFTREEAEQEGHRILNTVYAPVAFQTDHGVPVLPAAPVLVGDPADTNSAGNQAPSAQSSDSDVRPAAPVRSGTAEDHHPGDGPTEDRKPDDHVTGYQNSAAGHQQPGTQLPPTTPAALGSAPVDRSTAGSGIPLNVSPATQSASPTPIMAAGVAPSMTPVSGVTGEPGSPRNDPNPSAAPRGVGETPGGPGRSIPGQPPGPATAPNTVAGRTGTPGMSGLGPPPTGHRPDEDKTKGVPDYLVTKQHGAELTGLDRPPRVVPPVIGGDYDRAREY